MNLIAKAFPVLTQDLSRKYGKKNQMILSGYPSLQVVLRLVYISKGIAVPVGVKTKSQCHERSHKLNRTKEQDQSRKNENGFVRFRFEP